MILLSLAPVLAAGGTVLGLAWLYWAAAVDAVNEALSYWTLSDAVLDWLSSVGAEGLRAIVAPLIVVVLAVPAYGRCQHRAVGVAVAWGYSSSAQYLQPAWPR